MPKFPNSFLEAGVAPNHIRFTNIDTIQSYIYDDIPEHLVTFTYTSSGFIGTISDYEMLENIASTFLETISGDIQVVIDVTGKDEKGGLIGEIHIYNQLKEFGSITRLEKRTSYTIRDFVGNTEQMIQKIREKNAIIIS